MNTPYQSKQILAESFTALAHPIRLEILDLLRDGEACVCHIQTMLNQRQAYISQHLNVLRHAGLVSSRKDGLRVYYQISNVQLFGVIDEMKTFLQLTHNWQGDPLTTNNPRQICTCPQCTEKQLQIQMVVSHA